MPKFIDVSDCTDCPCYSGNYCNLDYTTDLRWTEDSELIYCSVDCKLVQIVHGDKMFMVKERKAINVGPV